MSSNPKTMTEMDRVVVVTPDIIVLVVQDPDAETPANKVMDLATLLANIPGDIISSHKLTVSGNTSFTGILSIPEWTPASSTVVCKKGRMGADSSYLYFAVADNNVKRIAWESF